MEKITVEIFINVKWSNLSSGLRGTCWYFCKWQVENMLMKRCTDFPVPSYYSRLTSRIVERKVCLVLITQELGEHSLPTTRASPVSSQLTKSRHTRNSFIIQTSCKHGGASCVRADVTVLMPFAWHSHPLWLTPLPLGGPTRQTSTSRLARQHKPSRPPLHYGGKCHLQCSHYRLYFTLR